MELSVWCIHKIGISGGLFTNQLLRETEVEIDPERIELLRRVMPRPVSDARARSARRPAHANCSSGRLKPQYLGQSRPAAGWKQQRSILLRSTSIPYKSLSSRAIRLDTQSRIQTCSWLHRSERSLDRTSTERSEYDAALIVALTAVNLGAFPCEQGKAMFEVEN